MSQFAAVVSDDEYMTAIRAPAGSSRNFSVLAGSFFIIAVSIREILFSIKGELYLCSIHALSLVAHYEKVVILGIEDIFLVWRVFHPAIHHLVVFILLFLDFADGFGIAVEFISFVSIFKFK